MQIRSYMRVMVLLMAVFFLSALSASAPAVAVADEGALASSEATAGDSGDEAAINCPHCGERIVIGRHGQEGQVMTCPKCGREICPGKPEKELCFGADLAFFSKYVSRGLVTTDGAVFEPNLWVSYKGFTVSSWMNMDLTDINDMQGDFNELDFAGDYSGAFDNFGYSAGVIYYVFPHTGAEDTSELYASLGYDVLLQPALTVYYDFWQVDGFYGAFSIGHSFGLPAVAEGYKASLDLTAQVGMGSKNFNEFNFGDGHTAFTDLTLTASLPVALTDNISVKPTVSYSSVLDRTIRTKNTLNDNVIFGGVVSASF